MKIHAENLMLWLFLLGALLLAILLAATGCASLRPGAVPELMGADTPIATQQGAVVTAIQDVTGIELEQALPLGLMPLLGWLIYLSHRREMHRIRRNGEHG